MPGRVEHREPDIARLVLIAIGERYEGKPRAGGFGEEDPGAGGCGELTSSGDVIRLDVGLQDVGDSHALFGRRLEIRLDVVLWIHHSARMCAASAEQVAGAPRLRREELAKDHGPPPCDFVTLGGAIGANLLLRSLPSGKTDSPMTLHQLEIFQAVVK